MSETPLLASPLTRRALFGRAAGAATTLVVSQTLMGCGTAGAALATDTGVGGGACVLTAALTEGPYFIDQKLNRSDIRTDPVTGIISTGIPLALTFNVSGWYSGRAVQTHFKLRLCAGATKTYEFTSQVFFDDALTDKVQSQAPYNAKGQRDLRNERDGIYREAGKIMVLDVAHTGDGYGATFGVGLDLSNTEVGKPERSGGPGGPGGRGGPRGRGRPPGRPPIG